LVGIIIINKISQEREERKKERMEEDPPDLKKEGWAERKTTVLRSWQKRYMAIEGQKFCWYSSAEKKKMAGYIDVDRAQAEEEEIDGKKSNGFSFTIRLKDGKKKYSYRTDTHKARAEWIDVINKSGDQTNILLAKWAKEDECVNCVALAALDESNKDPSQDDKESGEEQVADNKQDEPEKLSKLQVKDTTSNIHLLKDILGRWEFTVVALLRHFG